MIPAATIMASSVASQSLLTEMQVASAGFQTRVTIRFNKIS